MNVGNINIGITDEEDQKGIEAELKALSASHRLGPVKVNTDVLSAGCEMGIGRNNGGFVRANVASIGGNVGPVAGSLGIGFDSGARVGEEGVEIRALGTGFMVDRNEGIEVSVLGSKLKLKLW
ncbi:hypothetical protein HA402_015809 [Bradysia odoriphaga]|nr:hypothetical protein HA402_015809 [Bradysia odoriphaga]